MTMTARERFLACMDYRPVDRTPFWSWGGWPETLERWTKEGYDPAKGIPEEALTDPRISIHHWFFPNPGFEHKVVSEDAGHVVYINHEGILMKELKHNPQSSMPQFLKFPVETREDFRRFWRERMQPDLARSIFSAALQISAAPYEYTPLKKSYPWAWHRRMIRDVRRAQPLFAGDYYPLTGCTPGTDQWAAYQMHRPDLGEGLVMALRRQDSPFGEATFRLQGLKPRSVYEVEDADSGRKVRVAGRKLMEEGIKVSLKSAPESRLIFYRVVR